jgi:serine phosphatase RsbU (regulator of sigma subunit)
MLGKDVIDEIVRENASHCAAEILEAVITKIRNFQKGKKSDDDLTLVVVKATEND